MFLRFLRLLFPVAVLSITAFMLLNSSLRAASAEPDTLASTVEVPASCPVTKPPQYPFVPPAPYRQEIGPGGFWFGTETLWTSLPSDGTWNGLGHYTPDDPSFRQKLQFWSKGYDWHTGLLPPLVLTGKRLDAPAPPLKSDHANNVLSKPPSIMTAMNFPTLGCWQITARYHNAKLTFVIWVTH